MKQGETVWNNHSHRHLWFPGVFTPPFITFFEYNFGEFFFTPPFITFFTRNFTPVGKSLHEQRSHRSHLFPPLVILVTENMLSKIKHCPFLVNTALPVMHRGCFNKILTDFLSFLHGFNKWINKISLFFQHIHFEIMNFIWATWIKKLSIDESHFKKGHQNF